VLRTLEVTLGLFLFQKGDELLVQTKSIRNERQGTVVHYSHRQFGRKAL
jgi:hypothetical protein